ERAGFAASHPEAARSVAVLPFPVEGADSFPDRTAARRLLRLPDDVPVAAWVAEPGLPSTGSDLAREAFRRARVFFPGSRLIVAGAGAPSEPGVLSLAQPTDAERAAAMRAADILLVPPPAGGAREVLTAMRAGIA